MVTAPTKSKLHSLERPKPQGELYHYGEQFLTITGLAYLAVVSAFFPASLVLLAAGLALCFGRVSTRTRRIDPRFLDAFPEFRSIVDVEVDTKRLFQARQKFFRPTIIASADFESLNSSNFNKKITQAKVAHELGHCVYSDYAQLMFLIILLITSSIASSWIIIRSDIMGNVQSVQEAMILATLCFSPAVIALLRLQLVLHAREFRADQFANQFEHVDFRFYLKMQTVKSSIEKVGMAEKLLGQLTHPSYEKRLENLGRFNADQHAPFLNGLTIGLPATLVVPFALPSAGLMIGLLLASLDDQEYILAVFTGAFLPISTYIIASLITLYFYFRILDRAALAYAFAYRNVWLSVRWLTGFLILPFAFVIAGHGVLAELLFMLGGRQAGITPSQAAGIVSALVGAMGVLLFNALAVTLLATLVQRFSSRLFASANVLSFMLASLAGFEFIEYVDIVYLPLGWFTESWVVVAIMPGFLSLFLFFLGSIVIIVAERDVLFERLKRVEIFDRKDGE
jgi:hypothetical protein